MNRETRHAPLESSEEEFVVHAVALHEAALLRYAARLLGDAHRARDVVQDVFVRLLAAPRAEVETHLAEWLFTVCRHRAVDVLRKEGRMSRLEDQATAGGGTGPENASALLAPEPRPGAALEAAETRAALLRLIDRLPPNQQEVIRLKFQTGFSYKEISRITELSVSNVGFLIHTAVHRLRAEFAAQKP
jgi:RNA polymerase sigma-70 factor (ECF subfamily)